MAVEGKSLLIVEDDVRVRELAEFAATKSGVFDDVSLASDGTDAVRQLWRTSGAAAFPTAILTDLSMPGMDGLQLTRALKAHPATLHVPIFMFSSSGRPNDRELALAAGCEEFFPKPISLPQLLEMMQAIEMRLATTVHRP